MPNLTQLVWFRSDLRTADNPALFCAGETGQPCIGVFFICEKQWRLHDYGVVKVDFILRQLATLKEALAKLYVPLLVYKVDYFKDIASQLAQLAQQHGVATLWCNQEYEVNEVARDASCKEALASIGVGFEALHDQCILPPGTVTTQEGQMYKVFTPFFKRWQEVLNTSPVECAPLPCINRASQCVATDIPALTGDDPKSTYIGAQLPEGITQAFPAGETHALHMLQSFIDHGIQDYKTMRDSPSAEGTSKLSPYLAVGAISARQCYTAAVNHLYDNAAHTQSIQHWLSELCWRDFYRHIIVAFAGIVRGDAFHQKVDKAIPWRYHEHHFAQWCDGKTGVPLVDAAMRCLNATGFMHNRLRMVVAMFLTKNLLIDWRWGERYFMQHLVDADFASNNGGWQWSASVGTDAAPYFRIMNPFSQAKTHDAHATFIKQWVPELTSLEPKVIHDEARLAKIARSVGYLPPMVDTKLSRKQAIEAFKLAK